MNTSIDIHKLTSVRLEPVGRSAMKVINAIQLDQMEEQVAGAAVAFLALCARLKVHPGTAMAVGQRILQDVKSHTPELKAVQMYYQEQIK